MKRRPIQGSELIRERNMELCDNLRFQRPRAWRNVVFTDYFESGVFARPENVAAASHFRRKHSQEHADT
jgi:hypothetical protein